MLGCAERCSRAKEVYSDLIPWTFAQFLIAIREIVTVPAAEFVMTTLHLQDNGLVLARSMLTTLQEPLHTLLAIATSKTTKLASIFIQSSTHTLYNSSDVLLSRISDCLAIRLMHGRR